MAIRISDGQGDDSVTAQEVAAAILKHLKKKRRRSRVPLWPMQLLPYPLILTRLRGGDQGCR